MPPVLDPSKSRVDGLAFLGLSLTRHSLEGHQDSITHQTAFDLNEVQDREYEYIFSSNDDGWLVGGGEPGPPKSYKLAAKDTAHVEIMRIGTYNEGLGGIELDEIVRVMNSGKILIPQMEILPTAVVANADMPPELEVRFDMRPNAANENINTQLPTNWCLRFVHNQLFQHFNFPSRFCPSAFNLTILRKAEFRSEAHRSKYFTKCGDAITKWRNAGPRALNTGGWGPDGKALDPMPTDEYNSGIWLFSDRHNITHFFSPNFLPPYDIDPIKRKKIADVLSQEWDEDGLDWKPVGAPAGIVSIRTKQKKGKEGSSSTTIDDLTCGMMSSMLNPSK